MSIEFKISNQYLRSNRKKGFVSFISGVSIVGLVLGVITLITVLSVMNGFHKELRNRVLGAISHAYITGYGDTIENWQTLQAKINQHPNVISTSPYIQKYALINASFGSQGIRIRGIQPKLEKKTSVLLDKIKSGNAELGKSNILIGTGLATKLGVRVGNKVTLLVPQLSANIMGIQPRFKRFTVSGIFDAGIGEYDNNLAFIDLHQAQLLYAMKGKVSGIRLKVDDLFNAKKITNEVVNSLNSSQYYGVDWTQQKANFIKALNLEKQMIAIILSLIIAVAAFNIVSMMVMVVTDKKADIAILRTIGMTPKRIVKLFFYQGITIGIIGIVIGTILGVLLALNIEAVIGVIESILGFQFFPKDVFYISRFPSEIHLDDVIMVTVGAFVLVVLASIYPAKRAGKLQISEVLNHE
ncbi:lipoprotein-releasing ABC transporter permease subunit [bacterium endosymbiont of Bathymodiolus sp. 5 South]|jgi:lipoprotein-releasing system permease protein|uniref:lipoprotein-releasing ABC transporter permease subunit n=1 Tax=bacterium endosymbiont of Bathymodiolus sp. 5 South TaxID=1181670 RepID=UPI0010B7639B|nr:lipoprotein-releasing ABC transporter permease subunit [bacterium endosymbiont of Bathymodiolus sp. 5 South]SHN89226.1 Lipoprotein releasing system transmembrane protein LolC [bacterium endosymbiont of Bathymodiolus sp. 5 South]VVH56740.1 Lipoprotein releasing system transmembrane protein lolC [uncultured Gammaproteobacteria bacterium]VVH62041.1 Lipoprotein releasing system transmembrane protein LolC [uncultured Gammaproteobacteria bacterium]VVM22605.1 Lipoprotein releasing system transmembr